MLSWATEPLATAEIVAIMQLDPAATRAPRSRGSRADRRPARTSTGHSDDHALTRPTGRVGGRDDAARCARPSVTTAPGQAPDIRLIGREHDGIRDETNGGALVFNRVDVSFQQALPGVTDPAKWSTVDGPYTATRTVIAGGTTSWRLQQAPAIAAPLRVLIEENEPSMRSDGAGGVQPAWDVVYVETFELS